MHYSEKLKLATQLYVFSLLVFAAMQVVGFASGGQAAQEGFELFANPVDYTARMVAAGNSLRLILLGDIFFMIGYGGAIGMTAYAYAPKNPPAAWIAGLGILLVVGLDLLEDVTLFLSLDMAEAGITISIERILAQANISAIKWLTSAIVLVVFTFTLPNETLLERALIWSTRILMPLGTSLFVIGTFDMRPFGGLIILAAMCGGLALLGVTTGLRAQKAG